MKGRLLLYRLRIARQNLQDPICYGAADEAFPLRWQCT